MEAIIWGNETMSMALVSPCPVTLPPIMFWLALCGHCCCQCWRPRPARAGQESCIVLLGLLRCIHCRCPLPADVVSAQAPPGNLPMFRVQHLNQCVWQAGPRRAHRPHQPGTPPVVIQPCCGMLRDGIGLDLHRLLVKELAVVLGCCCHGAPGARCSDGGITSCVCSHNHWMLLRTAPYGWTLKMML